MDTFDVMVIGGGSAGFVAALKAVEGGFSVALAEKHKLGGECPNYACLPSKALLHSVHVLFLAEHGDMFGIQIPEARGSLKAMMASKEAIVEQLTGSPRLENMLSRSNITHLKGEARFMDPHTLRIGGKTYRAEHFVIATGSDPFIPPIPGLIEAGYLTSIDASMLKKLPRSLAIIGAGPVGCEYAQFFIRLHSNVWLIQRGERILDREDKDTSQAITRSFEKQGVKIRASSEITKVQKTRRGKVLTLRCKDSEEEIAVDEIFVMAGRKPDLSGLHLGKVGVKVNERGWLILDEYLRTTVPHIWAAGDAAGRYLFTHVAAYEGDIVGWNLLHPHQLKKPDYRVIPRATFTYPEVGSVGMTEEEAIKKGFDVAAASYPLKVMGRGLTVRETEGFIKLVVDRKTNQILGGHMVGSQAGEVIHEIALAMFTKTLVSTLGKMVHAFPTMAESVSFVTERLLSQRGKVRGAV